MSETHVQDPPKTDPPEPPKEVPEWAKAVPEKFRRATEAETIAELSKGYGEAEKALRSRQGDGLAISGEAPKVTQAVESFEDLLKGTGLDRAEVDAHFAQHGTLSDSQFKAIAEKKGIGKGLVKEFIEGRKAKAELVTRHVQSLRTVAEEEAGGAEKLVALKDWAQDSENFAPDQRAIFNQLVGDGATPASVKMAIRMVKEAQQTKLGTSGSAPLNGTTHGGGARGGFTTPKDYHDAVARLNTLHMRGEDDAALSARIVATSDAIIRKRA